MNFKDLSEKYMDKINEEMENFLVKETSEIETSEDFVRYFCSFILDYSKGGKRLRPLSLLLSYFGAGGKEDKILLPGVALELHHTYSLILDDIMDEDYMRRGKPNINKMLTDFFENRIAEEKYSGSMFGKKSQRFIVSFAVMLGNITNILSKKLILSSDFPDAEKIQVLKIIEDADLNIYSGQMMDMLMEQKSSVSEEYYLEMIKLKTAVLFGCAFECGAVLSGAPESTVMQLKEFGILSALSFQIQDDILDLEEGKGHELGSDIRKGKKTLIYLKMMEKAFDNDKMIIKKIHGKNNASSDDIKEMISVMRKTGAIDYCTRLAEEKNKEAKEILSKIKVDEIYKEAFQGFADCLIHRRV
ncbi:MAG: polyprenyl synthetase family protein [archaeon]